MLALLTLQSGFEFQQHPFQDFFFSLKGPKGDRDFRISDLVKNPDGTDI